jgi:hypothetical protein
MLPQKKRQRWWTVVGAGYLVVGVFAAGYLATAWVNSDAGTGMQVTVGVLLAAPLANAFLWERLRTVKVLGFEIELSEVTVDVPPLGNPALEDAIADKQYFSGEQAILEQISWAVQAPNKNILEINLRSKPYWWSTRLYLQAALLMDHSQVSRLVIVEGDAARRYVGITRTRHLRDALAESMPCLETIYRRLAGENQSVDDLMQRWVAEQFDGQSEIDAKTRIHSKELRTILGKRLETSAVEYNQQQKSEAYFQILAQGDRFVAMVNQGRFLDRIVDADTLARQLALNAMDRSRN